jgi:hypothetical protein
MVERTKPIQGMATFTVKTDHAQPPGGGGGGTSSALPVTAGSPRGGRGTAFTPASSIRDGTHEPA